MKAFITATSLVTLWAGVIVDVCCAGSAEGLLMTAKTTNLYDFTMDDIDGKPVTWAIQGKASGRQYGQPLWQYPHTGEAIYEQYHDKGFEILAFPPTISASRNRERTGDQGLCLTKYSVSFPSSAKSASRI